MPPLLICARGGAAKRRGRGFSGGMNSPLWPRVRLRGRAVLMGVDRDYPAPIPHVPTLMVDNERRCLADPPTPPAPPAPPPTSGGMNSPLWPRVRLRGRAVLMWVGRDYSAPIPPAPTLFVENERSRPSYPPAPPAPLAPSAPPPTSGGMNLTIQPNQRLALHHSQSMSDSTFYPPWTFLFSGLPKRQEWLGGAQGTKLGNRGADGSLTGKHFPSHGPWPQSGP